MGVDYLGLAKKLGIKFATESGSNITGHCPLHVDEKVSFSFDVERGLWKCFNPSCPGFKGGNFTQLYKKLTGEDFEEDHQVPISEIEAYHHRLKDEPAILKWLRDARGISEAGVDRFMLGWDGERLCIPIKAGPKYVNLRRHAVRKGEKIKTLSYRPGFGSLKLYPEENLSKSEILFCEGELDTILACMLGFNAITVTGGTGSWKAKWTPYFKDKLVNVCQDIDGPGRQGAQSLCLELRKVAKTVKNVLLPLTSPPNADITDYIVTYGHSADDFRNLIENTPVFDPQEQIPLTSERPPAKEVDLSKAGEAGLIGKLVKMRVTAAGKDLAPYACPKDIEFTCQMGLRICKLCSIGAAGGRLEHTIHPLSMEVLKLINCSEEQQRGFIRKSAGIYPGCPRFDMKPKSFHTVEDVRLIPEVNFSSESTGEYVVRPAFTVGHPIRPNSSYEVEGMVIPNPKNQYVTYILDRITQVKDNVEGFVATPEIKEALKVFQGQDVAAKMNEIASDLSRHVTHIYQRENLVQAVDLVYHSVLQFYFQGRIVKKGWTELLVMGDTRCGKTETVVQMINHYRAGEFAAGENCSYAGLIGGMQQLGNRWSITWGKLPLNDRRLLVIDEVSGMPVEDVGRMSGVRSSGIAEITKVQSEKTFSRTRMIWIGNPRSPRPLGSYDAGILAIKELIGRPEDVARFDLAIAVASGEVPVEIINQNVRDTKTEAQVYSGDLCHDLVMWAWSRRPEQVMFTKEAEETVLKLAADMSARYSSAVPLVEPAEQRIKLARLSVACAARLFSTDDGDTVIVKPAHVEYVHRFLESLYTSPAMGYLAYSKLKNMELTLKQEPEVRNIVSTHGVSFVEGLLERQYLRLTDIEDLLGMEKKDAKILISQLVQQRALKHYNTAYVKNPAFIQLLRKMQSEGPVLAVPGTEI